MASWLVCSPPDQAVWVQALAGDMVLCSWARHFMRGSIPEKVKMNTTKALKTRFWYLLGFAPKNFKQ